MIATDLQLYSAYGVQKSAPRISATGKDEAAADKAAKEFEAVFVSQMLSAMFEGVKTDGPFGGGAGESLFRSMMIDQYSKTISSQGGFGLADQVKREILRLQEMAG